LWPPMSAGTGPLYPDISDQMAPTTLVANLSTSVRRRSRRPSGPRTRCRARRRGSNSASASDIRDGAPPPDRAARLVVDRHDDDAVRRGPRSGEEKSPVEGQVFDPIQGGSRASDLIDATPRRQARPERLSSAARNSALTHEAFTRRNGKAAPELWLPPIASARERYHWA
jgi:hypothetical protein